MIWHYWKAREPLIQRMKKNVTSTYPNPQDLSDNVNNFLDLS